MSDLISREYIKLFVCEYEKFNGKETEIVKAVPIQAIDNAPTVERPQGEWINLYPDGLIAGECSACHWQATQYEDDVVGMPFCPNCGAEMNR